MTSSHDAPWMAGEAGFRIGLNLLDVDRWMVPGADAGAQFANKRKLLAERHGDVVAVLPGSEVAQGELLALLAGYLQRQFPDLYERDGATLRRREFGKAVALGEDALAPIDRAGRLVQEDLCLLEAQGGTYVLTAASLCAPSAWRLADKIGRPLLRIHGPVPGYAEELAARVDRIFAFLKADQPVWRSNWSIMSEDTLFLPGSHDRSADRLVGLLAQTAGDRLFLRTERQTLRRLPVSGAIVFTILTSVRPLRAIGQQPDLMRGLKRAIEGMPEGMARYKAMAPIRDAVLGWLDWCLRVYAH